MLEILYYQDDAVEILSISEEWTRWIVQTPVVVPSGWGAFVDSFKKGLTGKLPLIGLAIDMALTTWEFSDEGLFSNPEYYAALLTDGALFVGGAAVMAGVAALGLVGAPAILATLGAAAGWAILSSLLEEPLREFLTPAFEWIGARIGDAVDWTGERLEDLGQAIDQAADWMADQADAAADWTRDRLEDLDQAVDNATDWVADRVDDLADSFGDTIRGLVPSFGW